MIKCKYCGGDNPDNNKFCMNCGAPLDHDAKDAAEQQAYEEHHLPVETEVQKPEPEPEQIPTEQYNNVQPPFNPAFNMPGAAVEPVPIGGLIAWAIFVCLGCLIPGAVALFYIFKINKSASVEEQQMLLSRTKKILIAGTVLCVINLIMQMGGSRMN